MGPYRITLGYSTGQWQNEAFGCDGSFLSATPVAFQSVGAELEAWPYRDFRVTAFGGTTSQRVGQTVGDSARTHYVEDYHGGFGGAQVAVEGRYVGVGLGVMSVGGDDGFGAPSLYLRFGDINRGHVRIEGLGPSAIFPAGGWARIGVGYNQGHRRGTGGFFGVGLGPIDYTAKPALLGEARLPLGPHLSGQLHGLLGPGERGVQWTTGFNLRYDFGGR